MPRTHFLVFDVSKAERSWGRYDGRCSVCDWEHSRTQYEGRAWWEIATEFNQAHAAEPEVCDPLEHGNFREG